ncbi:aspartate aminotransferase family protein [Natrialbaceae archaeon A-chndr2]|uniref:aspartate aminotransferase family protein n=1 Tax=Natronosalvus amylolyticus TaxID=2961994 RepID=UPI0020C99BA5|nr:aspartate aminotransferase family protein [Natronosalvus amylolyticus]
MAVDDPLNDLHYSDAPRVDTAIPGPRSQQLLERQAAHEGATVAYPNAVPIALESGKGATVRDLDGNTYIDLFAGVGVLNVGHSNPYVLEGTHEQLDDLVHTLDFPTEARLDLIEALDDIVPGGLQGENRIVFGGPTGSDAVETSIKLAKYNTGGDGLIAFRGAYHGASAGALSLTAGRKYKRDYSPLLPNVTHVPYPYPFQQECSPETAARRSIENLTELLEDPYSGFTNPAGIWIEPIQGEGGITVPPKGFLTEVQAIANEHDIPLIVDEIQTGFGRTGEWFASDWDGVTPDVMPIAKALGGIGLPLSATVYHESLDTWGPGGHIGTYRGHVPAMVAGLRAIEFIRDHDLLAHARSVGKEMRQRILSAVDDLPGRVDVRGRGLFTGVEFLDSTGEPQTDLVNVVQRTCLENGVIVWTAGRHGNVLRIIPPLVITHEQAETSMNILAEAIRNHATAGPNQL